MTPECRLTGGVAYLDPRYHKTSDEASRNNYVTNLSRWAVKLGAEWEPSFFDGLTLSAHLSSQSKQYLDKANSYYVPSVTTYDIGARYRTSLAGNPLTLRLSIENLTNKAYCVAPLSQGQGSPRTVLLSATMNFSSKPCNFHSVWLAPTLWLSLPPPCISALTCCITTSSVAR